MKQLDIGGSGVLGSAIGVGCMRMNCMEPQAILEYIHTALEKGINFFDHADIYGGGECETRFGQALALEPGLREKLVLQTKCGIRPDRYDFSKEHILESVEGSLRRLAPTTWTFCCSTGPTPSWSRRRWPRPFTGWRARARCSTLG